MPKKPCFDSNIDIKGSIAVVSPSKPKAKVADSFKYTDARYKTDIAPYFDGAEIAVSDITKDGFKVTFSQAKIEKEYVNDYKIVVKEANTGLTVKQACLWSEYYFFNMPETLSISFDGLKENTEYDIQVIAGSFWNTYSEPITARIKTN